MKKALVFLLLSMIWVPAARAGALTSDQLLLVYNRNSEPSRELAEYYAAQRSVPSAQLLGLDLPATERIPREDYDRLVLAPVRAFLWEHQLARQIRCLVTFYDVPLAVGPRVQSPAERERIAWMETQHEDGIRELDQLMRELQILAEGATGARLEMLRGAELDDKRRGTLLTQYPYWRQSVYRRLRDLGDSPDAADVRMKFLELAVRTEGISTIAVQLRRAPEMIDERIEKRLEQFQEAAQGLDDLIAPLLADGPFAAGYPEGIKQLKVSRGLTYTLTRLARDLRECREQDSDCALDSELALLWWRPYELNDAVWNWLNVGARQNAQDTDAGMRDLYAEATLLVARLDGPGPQIVRRMIDDTIAAEREGLAGRVCLDRDLSRTSDTDLIVEYSMAKLQRALRNRSDVPLTVNDEKSLFAPGECPETALYAGWMSPGDYVDAFDWQRGGIGMHFAPDTAAALHSHAKSWAGGMLADGAAAVLGAIGDPRSEHYPATHVLYAVLMSGEFSLGEAWALANVANSWRVFLIGDPLYRPFAARPRLRLEDVLSEKQLPIDLSPDNYEPPPQSAEEFARPPARTPRKKPAPEPEPAPEPRTPQVDRIIG